MIEFGSLASHRVLDDAIAAVGAIFSADPDKVRAYCAGRQASDLPHYHWVKITGEAFVHDLGVRDGVSIIVSERALEVFRAGRSFHLEVENATPGGVGEMKVESRA